MKRFIEVDPPNGEEPSSDTRYFERSFTGPLTVSRMLYLEDLCKANTWRESCGHEWDCCGCQFQERWTWKYGANQVTISIRKSYNY